MKKIIIIMIILIIIYISKIPPYNELNNISIIDGIGIEKKDSNYILYLREIIPNKKENGITYEYKIYQESTENILKGIENLQKKKKKKLYLNKVKFIVTNYQINSTHKSIKIYQTKNVLNKLKSIQQYK